MAKMKAGLKEPLIEIFEKYGLYSEVWVYNTPNRTNTPLYLAMESLKVSNPGTGSIEMYKELVESVKPRRLIITEMENLKRDSLDGYDPLLEKVYSGEKIYG